MPNCVHILSRKNILQLDPKACPNKLYIIWQSRVEIEHNFVVYLDCVTAFEALYM